MSIKEPLSFFDEGFFYGPSFLPETSAQAGRLGRPWRPWNERKDTNGPQNQAEYGLEIKT
jgi:hypothetical protein